MGLGSGFEAMLSGTAGADGALARCFVPPSGVARAAARTLGMRAIISFSLNI
jgi:hypothetical protein